MLPNFSLIFAERKVFNRIYLSHSVGLQAGPLEFASCIASRRRVVIGSDNDAGVIENCLPHEFMHAFGFYYHACYYRPFVLCLLDGRTTTFSKGDSLLLATLYDPNIKNGMGREEALPIARALMRQSMGYR